LADRLPPSRYSVVERGCRLVVIDRDTGAAPLTAAERMAEHDRRMGHEPMRAAIREAAPAEPAPLPAQSNAKALEGTRPKDRMAAAVGAMNRKQPWKAEPKSPARAEPARPEPARIARRPRPSAGGGARKTIVTSKWWDARGPRSIELGPKGQQTLSGGFVTLFFVGLIAAIVALFVQPILFFIGGFLLFRFGGQILGPIGAGIVDKAVAKKG
jgi:hypothetical protein